MENLWQFLEDERSKANEEQLRAQVEARAEKEKKEKEKRFIKQYNEITKEYNNAVAVVEANYIFNYFLLDTFPRFIKNLIENNHNALLHESSINGKITHTLSPKNEFEYDIECILRGISFKNFCSSKMIYFFENNEINLTFTDRLIYMIFKEKLNRFLIKNQIINLQFLIKNQITNIKVPDNNTNLFPYLKVLRFKTNIESLIKAYENGIKQIREEQDDLKALMDTWNIGEENIEEELGININSYNDLIATSLKEMQLTPKKK